MTSKSFTCLIPAYNEAARLPGVLKAVLGHPFLKRVVVIDDGSTDGTGDVARKLGAELLRAPENLGKTRALLLGLETVKTSHVILIDGDLLGLTPASITALIAPVLSGASDASVSLRGNAPWTWRQIGLDYISGERVIPMSLVADQFEELAELRRFGFEVFLNQLLVANEKTVSVVRWPTVVSPPKSAKRGVWEGLRANVAMLADIAGTIGIMGFAGQIRKLRNLCVS